jgi:outer membrane lipoprotein-sorting protein
MSSAAAAVPAIALLAVCCVCAAGPAAALTAAQIVQENANARGGVAAWKQVETMAWVGHIESGKVPGRRVPFLLELRRPNSTRFEVAIENQKAIRAYDGSMGWKLHPTSNGLPELQPYSQDELSFARGAQAILGPLMDDVAQGGKVELEGSETVDGHGAYVLDVLLPDGMRHRVWVDAESFLDVKYERNFRNTHDQIATTTVVYRDFRTFQGLKMPVVIESSAATGSDDGKMVIERVALNPPLDDRDFAKPAVPSRHRNGVTIDARGPAPGAGVNSAPP